EWLAALAVEPARLLTLDGPTRERVTHGALMLLLDLWRQGRPAALLVDQVELLDSPSLDLLCQAAETPSAALLMVLAGREAPRSLPRAARRIDLGPLPPSAAGALL